MPSEDGRHGWSVLYLFSRDAQAGVNIPGITSPTAHHFYPEPNKKREKPGGGMREGQGGKIRGGNKTARVIRAK